MGQKLLSQQLPREKPLFPFPVAFLFGERLHQNPTIPTKFPSNGLQRGHAKRIETAMFTADTTFAGVRSSA